MEEFRERLRNIEWCHKERMKGNPWDNQKKEEGKSQREEKRDRARELHAIRITSSISHFDYVMSFVQLIGARSMHALN